MASRLELDIFGGDSDLSDISDAEEQPQKRASPPPEPISEDEGPEPDEHAGRARGDGDYVQPSGAPKATKQKGQSTVKRKVTKKAPQQQQEPEMEPELTPEERRRRELDQKLDAIIKKPKPKKRKRAGDEEDLGQAADEDEVVRLRYDMIEALQLDSAAAGEGRPALQRLKMLPRVEATLQKSHLELIALDQNILATLKEWLEPLPNKSLPALNIQRSIFAILSRMNIETVALKESGIGRIVNFYSRCARVESSIRRTADHLITVWMRPLLRRSAAWRDKEVQRAPRHDADMDIDSQPDRHRATSSLAPGMQDSATGRRHARIPQSNSTTYSVAPANRIDRSAAGTLGNNKEAMERFKQLNRQLKGAKAASKRL